jgi:NAD(P)-dependent dehydrogenase (short-subunit alcohol dehydrogenase family)
VVPDEFHQAHDRSTAAAGSGGFVAQRLAERSDDVIILSRSPARAQEVAAEIGATTQGLGLELPSRKRSPPLADIYGVDNLVLTAFATIPALPAQPPGR